MGMLKIGWAETDITPGEHISLAGQFAERISETIEKPLTATAMALEAGDEQAIICSTDLAAVNWTLLKGIRNRLQGNDAGLDPMKIMVAATHTHTGPVYAGGRRMSEKSGGVSGVKRWLTDLLLPGQKYVEKVQIQGNRDIPTPEEILHFLIDRIADVILEAWKNRTDGGFVNAFGRVPLGMCRRAKYSDGTAAMWGETNTACFDSVEGGEDTGVEMMYVFNAEGELTGVVVNPACPAQCVQHRLFVSPDYWGEAKTLIRKRLGEHVFMLPLCSPAGDQCPVDLVRWVEPYSDVNDPNILRTHSVKRKADPSMFDLEGMRKAGKRVANEVVEVYGEVGDGIKAGTEAIQRDVPFEHIVYDMQLPLRRATITEYRAAKKAIEEYLHNNPGDVDYNTVANLQRYTGVIGRYMEQERVDVVEAETHILRLGSVAIATNPFELFLDYGNRIKARSDAEQTFLVQLCNGSDGYLPTEKAEAGGHYSAFIPSGTVGHQGGDQYVREVLKHIRELFEEET